MKPLPNLSDERAMLERGRRSALMSARNEACEALRDAAVSAQTMPHPEMLARIAPTLRKIADRLEALAILYEDLEQSKQQTLPLEGA